MMRPAPHTSTSTCTSTSTSSYSCTCPCTPALLVLPLLLLSGTPSALAAVESDLGLGSRATALGGAFTALADDFSAAHYNPAGIALAPVRGRAGPHGVTLHLGYLWSSPDLWVRTRRESGDKQGISSLVEPRAPSDGHGPDIAHPLPTTTGLTFGCTFDLERVAGIPRAHLGLALYFPLRRFFRWDIMSSAELQWPAYLDRTQHMSILPVLAFRIHERLSVGVGARVSVAVETNTEARVLPRAEGGSAGEVDAEMGNEVTIGGRVAPTFGVLARPTDWLRVGLAWRGALWSDDWGYDDVDTEGLPGLSLGSFGFTHRFAHYYQPMEVAAGAAAGWPGLLMLSADVTWADWSDYLDSNHDDHGGELHNATLTPRVGLALQATPTTELLAGYAYVPSPFDNGGGWTNFVDNDKHVVAIGGQVDLAPWIGWSGRALRIALHAQLHLLRDRVEVKDWQSFANEAEAEANPGWPGWRSGGRALSLGVSLDAEL